MAFALLASLLVFGLVLRLLLRHTYWSTPDADELTGELMALRASQGHLALLFSGLDYAGAALSWVEAPLIAVFGFNASVFWVVDTLVALVGAGVLWLVAKRLLTPVAAAVVAGAFWLFPPLWVFWSMREYLSYVPAVVLGLVTCWLLLRWTERRSVITAALAGFSAGLAVWSYPLELAVVVPALGVFAWAARRDRTSLMAMAGGAILGVGPYVAYFVIHRKTAIHPHPTLQPAVTTFNSALTRALPAAFGVTHAPELFGITVYVVAIACGVLFAWRGKVALAVCAATIVLWPIMLVLARVPVLSGTYRYTFTILPSLLLLGGYLLSLIRLSVAGVVAACVVVFITASTQTRGFAAISPCGGPVAATGAYLLSQGRPDVWASYWVASVLTVCEYPKVTAGVLFGKADAESNRAAAATNRSTYVVYAGQGDDGEIARWTSANHVTGRRVVIGRYAVWIFDASLPPGKMNLRGGF